MRLIALTSTMMLTALIMVASADERPTALTPGVAVRRTVTLAEDARHVYRLRIPPTAIGLLVTVRDTPLTVNLSAHDVAELEDAEAPVEGQDNRLFIGPLSEVPLAPGRLFITVDHLAGRLRLRGRRVATAAYSITATLILQRTDGALTPGGSQSAALGEAEGYRRTYTLEVPEGAKALRIDLDRTVANLDLMLRHGEPAVRPDEADHVAETPASREVLLIDGSSRPPLKPGRYYVHVVEPTGDDAARFTIHASLTRDPPASLRAIPALSPGDTPRTRALAAAVEVNAGNSSGSGTLVGAGGLVLTNHHVVAEAIPLLAAEGRVLAETAVHPLAPAVAGRLDEIVIGVTLDPRQPAVEMFRGQLIAHSERLDMALIQITSGYYGQPLPAGYRFPHAPLGDPKRLVHGDPLWVVGYPDLAGLRSRPTLHLSRGVVGGFERSYGRSMRIRTDAQISSGSSGGGAFDGAWRLVGMPTMTTSDDTDSVGFVFSLEDLPPAWRARISG